MSSRFRITEHPEALPAQCKICGAAEKEWFLDTATSEEYWGAVYYCCECIAEMARVCGFATPGDVNAMRNHILELESRERRLLEENEDLRKAIDSLSSAWTRYRTDPLHRSTVDSSFFDKDPQRTEDQLGTGEGTPVESSDDEGVELLRSDDSAEQSAFGFQL